MKKKTPEQILKDNRTVGSPVYSHEQAVRSILEYSDQENESIRNLLNENKVSFKQELYNARKLATEMRKQISELQSALATERHKLTAISKGINPR